MIEITAEGEKDFIQNIIACSRYDGWQEGYKKGYNEGYALVLYDSHIMKQ